MMTQSLASISNRERVVWAYRYYRALSWSARLALASARAAVAAGNTLGGPRTIMYCRPSEDGTRWIESPEPYLRRCGYADEIDRSIRHAGWYTEDDGLSGETLRGVVYQLPARDGRPLYVPGYVESWNDDGAVLSFGDMVIGGHGEDEDARIDAARRADRIAEIAAERERDYNRAWQAGREYADLEDKIASARTTLIGLLSERRAAMRAGAASLPHICATIERRARALIEEIREARERRKELREDFGSHSGFADAAA